MVEFKIVSTLEGPEKQRWDAFMDNSPYKHFYQKYDWGLFQRAESGRDILYFCGTEQGDIKIAAQILRRKLPWFRRFNYEVSGGPIFADPGIFKEGMQFLERQLGSSAVRFEIAPQWPMNEAEEISSICANLGFKPLEDPTNPWYGHQTVLVDLARPVDAIFQSFRYTTRYEIRQAEKEGLDVRIGNDASVVDMFYRLYWRQSQARQRAPTSERHFELLYEHFLHKPENGSLAVATGPEGPISASMTTRCGTRSWYIYGASDIHSKLERSTSHLRHWRVMCYLREQGCEVYDFSGAFPNYDRRTVGFGVNVFKTGFSKHFVSYSPPYAKIYSPALNVLTIARRRSFQALSNARGRLMGYKVSSERRRGAAVA